LFRRDIDSVVDVAAPNPLPNAEFMLSLREAYGVPFGLPASGWMLGIGAAFLRTETELILKSRRVVPARLLEHGFRFNHPHWSSAARDLCDQWRTTANELASAANALEKATARRTVRKAPQAWQNHDSSESRR
jgi:hypothetical protein